MTILFDRPITCPVLIGRIHDVAALHRLLEGAKSGCGQTTLISGEAGVGKSRLVAEAKRHATCLGVLTLEGHCFEPDRALPYAPFLDLLRTYFVARSPEEIACDLGPTGSELVKLLPELAARLSSLTPSPSIEPEQEKRRLFQAFTEFFIRLTTEQAALIVIEDLHWSDEASLECLLHLARHTAAQPIFFLLTYRSDELQSTLAHFLAELDRSHLATELALSRLTRDELETMLRTIFQLQRPVRREFLEAMYALTEGNPFFLEEVLKSLIAAGDVFYVEGQWDRKPMNELHIPRSVQDAVQRRVAQLSEPAWQLLTLAAVFGCRFDFDLLQELTHMSERELLLRMKELIAAQLIVEKSADEFAFRHALTQEAVYATLLRRERKQIHRLVAETLERLYSKSLDAHVSDLAHHFYKAELWEKALEYSRRAGDKAQAMYAPREAIEHHTRAIEAAQRLAQGLPLIKFYRARGQAYETVGEFEHAHGDYEQALAMARRVGDQMAEWQGLIDLGFLWAARDYAQTGDYYRQALDLARALEDPAVVAHTLNRVGNWHLNIADVRQALEYYAEALTLFESLNDQRGLSQTLDLLGMASGHRGDLRAINYYDRAIALFRELDDRYGLVMSLATQGLLRSIIGDAAISGQGPDQVARDLQTALGTAREIGWRSGEAYVLFTLGWVSELYGDYEQALPSARRGLEVAQEIEHRQWTASGHVVLGMIYLDLLALAQAHRHLEQGLSLAQGTKSLIWTQLAAGLLAMVHILQGELTQAEAILDDVARFTTPETYYQYLCVGVRAELALAQGKPNLALQLMDELNAGASPLANYSSVLAILNPQQIRGEALIALGQVEAAERAFRAALESAVARDNRPSAWRMHISLGKLYLDQKRSDEAEHEFTAARTLIETLAANIPDEPLRENFRRQAFAMIPTAPALSPRQAVKRESGGLTEREREVAVLIARGKSNREIANALVVSERTVESHISNILSKRDFTSRAQIAAWATEKGLGKRAE